MKTRLWELDLLRILAAFSVIMIHVSAAYIEKLSLAYYLNQFVRYAVPLFIIMSGLLIHWSNNNKSLLTTRLFYRQRFRHVITPYIIWTIFYTFFAIYLGHYPLLTRDSLLILGNNLLWGTGCYHLYFMVIIFQLYLLYPLLQKNLQQHPRACLVVSLLLTLFCQLVLYLEMLHIIKLPNLQSLYLVMFPVWIFYFVWGMYLANYIAQLPALLKKYSAFIYGLFLFSFLFLLLDSKLTGSYATSIRPSVILYTMSSFLCFYRIALEIKVKSFQYVKWLSNQSFLIFLLHPFILSCLVFLAPKISYPYLWEGISGMLSLYFITAFLTLFAVGIISYTPLAVPLGGTKSTQVKR